MQELTQEEFKQIETEFQELIEKQKMLVQFDPHPKTNRTLDLMNNIQKNLHFIQPK
jgi:hypothetical protein